jgi:hypothetical protein
VQRGLSLEDKRRESFMADVIELKAGQKPRAHGRYALVFVSSRPPKEGAPIAIHDGGQTFFADDDEHDVSVIVERAKVWADENNIKHVYVERDSH